MIEKAKRHTGFLRRPHRVWWRKAIFQVHLWTGIALCLYMLVIGVSGSILVFGDELETVSYPQLMLDPGAGSPALIGLPEAIEAVRQAYPGNRVGVAYAPKQDGHTYAIFINRDGTLQRVYVSPTSGRILGILDPRHSWLAQVMQIHFRLMGGRIGSILNGIGAIFLLLLCLSGLVIWWPGISNWRRGFRVHLHANWKRINFDLHSVTGIATLLVLSMWAATAVYFVWPKPVSDLISHVSSVKSTTPPSVAVPLTAGGKTVSLDVMIREAEHVSPQTKLAGVFFSVAPKSPVTVLLTRRRRGDFSQSDYVYINPFTGRSLGIWHRGGASTWGERLLVLSEPLHFGMYWGLGVKIIWALLGLALPLLAITGTLMYWNRSLKQKWRRLTTR